MTDKEEIEALKKDVLRLTEELRVANQKHKAAMNWAMNNAKCFFSHLKACRHDEVKGLETRLKETSTKKSFVKALTFAQHEALWGRSR